MAYVGDVVRFLSNGKMVSGKLEKLEVKEVQDDGLVVDEVMLLRNKIYETFEVLDENIEVIARGKITT